MREDGDEHSEVVAVRLDEVVPRYGRRVDVMLTERTNKRLKLKKEDETSSRHAIVIRFVWKILAAKRAAALGTERADMQSEGWSDFEEADDCRAAFNLAQHLIKRRSSELSKVQNRSEFDAQHQHE